MPGHGAKMKEFNAEGAEKARSALRKITLRVLCASSAISAVTDLATNDLPAGDCSGFLPEVALKGLL